MRTVIVAIALLFVLGNAQLFRSTMSPSDPQHVRKAYHDLQAAFSNLTWMTGSPGLGSLFTADGTWCSEKGSPCVTGATNITNYVGGFKSYLGLTDAIAHFSDLSVNGNYGSFDYVKTFACSGSCGHRTCLVPGKSGFMVKDGSSSIVELNDYVDNDLWMSLCIGHCTQC